MLQESFDIDTLNDDEWRVALDRFMHEPHHIAWNTMRAEALRVVRGRSLGTTCVGSREPRDPLTLEELDEQIERETHCG